MNRRLGIRLPRGQGSLQDIENKVGLHGLAYTSVDDARGMDIDHKAPLSGIPGDKVAVFEDSNVVEVFAGTVNQT
jgi:hypothetical protein